MKAPLNRGLACSNFYRHFLRLWYCMRLVAITKQTGDGLTGSLV